MPSGAAFTIFQEHIQRCQLVPDVVRESPKFLVTEFRANSDQEINKGFGCAGFRGSLVKLETEHRSQFHDEVLGGF